MDLPQDPMILLSYVNTQLRDNFSSLDEFCAAAGVEKESLVKKLAVVDYEYDAARNAFV